MKTKGEWKRLKNTRKKNEGGEMGKKKEKRSERRNVRRGMNELKKQSWRELKMSKSGESRWDTWKCNLTDTIRHRCAYRQTWCKADSRVQRNVFFWLRARLSSGVSLWGPFRGRPWSKCLQNMAVPSESSELRTEFNRRNHLQRNGTRYHCNIAVYSNGNTSSA